MPNPEVTGYLVVATGQHAFNPVVLFATSARFVESVRVLGFLPENFACLQTATKYLLDRETYKLICESQRRSRRFYKKQGWNELIITRTCSLRNEPKKNEC